MNHSPTKKTIVIADDDAELVQALQCRCESRGWRVQPAFDALSALNLVYETHPDLICLDVNMPCGNGLSVLEMILGEKKLFRTPVIIMTGDANEETVRRCHRYCAYYVEKCADVWSRLEPLVRELTDDAPSHFGSAAAICADQVYERPSFH